MCPTTSQNPFHWHPSWLGNGCTTRKDPESERLAKDNLETNPISIKPETTSHMAEQFSWVPLPSRSPPQASLSNKASCFVSMSVSLDDSFPSVRQEPPFRSWKGSPSCNRGRKYLNFCLSSIQQVFSVYQPCARFPAKNSRTGNIYPLALEEFIKGKSMN